MTWAKLDDRANEHRKQLAAGAEACWLWSCGLMYANRQKERDGFIPAAVLPMLYPLKNPKRLAATLVEVGLWELADGGYQVHDFGDWNKTAEQVEQERADARERMRVLRANNPPNRKRSSREHPPNEQRSAGSTPTPTPLPIPDQIPPSPPSGGTPDKPAKKPRRVLTDIGGWAGPTPEHRALALQLRVDLERENTAIRDWALSKGERKADWDAAFRGWLRRSAEKPAVNSKPPGLIVHQQFGGRGDPARIALDAEAASNQRLREAEARINAAAAAKRAAQ